MATVQNWHDESIEVARSSGGVLAAVDPWHNVIRTGVRPWPAPELIQKVCQSRQVRAFSGDQHQLATATLGFYSDLQSIHSEDAITWSVFGPVIYATATVREAFVSDLLNVIDVPAVATMPVSGCGVIYPILTPWYRVARRSILACRPTICFYWVKPNGDLRLARPKACTRTRTKSRYAESSARSTARDSCRR
jgi:hypothetical protein